MGDETVSWEGIGLLPRPAKGACGTFEDGSLSLSLSLSSLSAPIFLPQQEQI